MRTITFVLAIAIVPVLLAQSSAVLPNHPHLHASAATAAGTTSCPIRRITGSSSAGRIA